MLTMFGYFFCINEVDVTSSFLRSSLTESFFSPKTKTSSCLGDFIGGSFPLLMPFVTIVIYARRLARIVLPIECPYFRPTPSGFCVKRSIISFLEALIISRLVSET